jgi:hypothetical protein
MSEPKGSAGTRAHHRLQGASVLPVPARFKRLVASFAGERGVTLEQGWGKGNVVLKAEGRIFAIVGEARLVVKLPKARVDEIVEQGGGERFDPRNDGRLMKEWLVVRLGLNENELAKLAHAFVSGGEPKRGRPARRRSRSNPAGSGTGAKAARQRSARPRK